MKNIAEVLEWCENMSESVDMSVRMATVSAPVWHLYLYIRKYFPDIDVNVYLDHPKPIFRTY